MTLLHHTRTQRRQVLLVVQGKDFWLERADAEGMRKQYLKKLDMMGQQFALAKTAYAMMPLEEFMVRLGQKLDQVAVQEALQKKSF